MEREGTSQTAVEGAGRANVAACFTVPWQIYLVGPLAMWMYMQVV
jgi:hypothetical protein